MEIDKAVIINTLYNRIKAGDMTISQLPDIYKEEIRRLFEKDVDISNNNFIYQK